MAELLYMRPLKPHFWRWFGLALAFNEKPFQMWFISEVKNIFLADVVKIHLYRNNGDECARR